MTDLGAVHSQRRDWWRELSSTLAETRSHTERRTQLRSHLTAAPQTIWTSWAVARQRRIRHVGDHHTP